MAALAVALAGAGGSCWPTAAWRLVVGNSTYGHIGRLPNPDNDVPGHEAGTTRDLVNVGGAAARVPRSQWMHAWNATLTCRMETVTGAPRSVLPEGTGVSTQAGYRETLMRGLLARVGFDSTPEYGGSNAPMKPDRSFLYVPIPETDPESGAPLKQRKGMETRYSEINTGQFGWSLPLKLMGENTHLSPDFKHLNFCT